MCLLIGLAHQTLERSGGHFRRQGFLRLGLIGQKHLVRIVLMLVQFVIDVGLKLVNEHHSLPFSNLWKTQLKSAAGSFHGMHVDTAMVQLHDLLGQTETDAGTAGVSGEKRNEDAL